MNENQTCRLVVLVETSAPARCLQPNEKDTSQLPPSALGPNPARFFSIGRPEPTRRSGRSQACATFGTDFEEQKKLPRDCGHILAAAAGAVSFLEGANAGSLP
jgi:hypothetical protein